MIYFVQPAEGGPVKIGHTNNVEIRLTALRSAYGRDLVLIGKMDGGPQAERETHERFASLRIALTEQFRPGPELMDFLGLPHAEDWENVEAMSGRNNNRVHALQIRVNEEDEALIERIRQVYGLTTVAEVTRLAWYLVANSRPPEIHAEFSR